jgi:hypothetical protein
MIINYVIAGGAFFGIFVLFLVLSKTLNNVLNQFNKLQYLLQKEYDLKKEQLAISRLMKEHDDKPGDAERSAEEKKDVETVQQNSKPNKNANSKTA